MVFFCSLFTERAHACTAMSELLAPMCNMWAIKRLDIKAFILGPASVLPQPQQLLESSCSKTIQDFFFVCFVQALDHTQVC